MKEILSKILLRSSEVYGKSIRYEYTGSFQTYTVGGGTLS